jgi:hypothetical protein
MANAISSALHAQQVAQAAQTYQAPQNNPTSKQNATRSAAPQDSVTISRAGQAASQAAQSGQTGNDGDRDGQ